MIEVTMRERKKEATKNKIIKIAVAQINENGFAGTTMQQVAKKADVALRTLYNYFPTKEAIVATYMRNVVLEEAKQNWNDLLELDTTYERLLLICRRTSDWSQQNHTLTEVYAADPRNYYYASSDHVPRSGIDELVARVMEMGQRMGDIDKEIPLPVLVRQFMGVFYLSILTWLGDSQQDLDVIFKEGIDILYRGIRTNGVDAGFIFEGMFC